MTRVKMVCGSCGSENVRRDAYAEWNVEIQQWQLAGDPFDAAVCESDECNGEETDIEEEPFDSEEGA